MYSISEHIRTHEAEQMSLFGYYEDTEVPSRDQV